MVILKIVSYINLEKQPYQNQSRLFFRLPQDITMHVESCVGGFGKQCALQEKTKQRRHFHSKVIRLFMGEKGG